ncbi:MFS transporter [Runella sp.]|jgi:benzoate transport|uniref:MFS transporter n=1 Tax=Runella sp. TaxID=1960881 RepID=UPI002623B557|nr:MFS transporter [Runella sp.]
MTYEALQTRFKSLIDHNPMSTFQVLIVAICFILNMNDGIDVLVVSFSGSEIVKEWGLSKTELGYIFSAGLMGMTVGAFFLAPLGDTIGRRKVFILSLVLITSGMLLVFISAAYWQLLLLRFLTGMGIGGILPTMAATASEFSNNKRRDFNVGLVQAGGPVGAIFTGFFCAYAIPAYGWRFAFLFAGGISLLMLVLVWVYMTDSLDFLSKQQPENAQQKINILLSKMGHEGISALPEKPLHYANAPVKALFSPEYRNSTFKLWVAIFFGFLTLYTLMSWVPNIAKEAGLPFEMATYVGIALNAGAAIGTAGLGVVAARLGLRKTVLSFMLCAFVVILIYGNVPLTTTLIFVTIFLIGIFVQGGFNGIYPTISRVYPTEIRTTGVGFSIGVGRFGAILGPTLFGVLSDAGFSTALLFSLFSLPLLVTGLFVFSLKSKNLDERNE